MVSAKKIVFAVFIMCIFESAEASLHLSTTTDVSVGDNITLSCKSTTDLVNNTLIWRRDGIAVSSIFINSTGCYDEYFITNTSYTSYTYRCGEKPVKKIELIIPPNSMTEDQQKKAWTCTIAIGPVSNIVTLNNSVPISSANLKPLDGNDTLLFIEADDIAQFVCTFGPSRTPMEGNRIQWFRNNQTIPEETDIPTTDQTGDKFITISRLNITGEVGNDKSNITCSATVTGHSSPVVSNAVELVVLWKPSGNVTLSGYETSSTWYEGSSPLILTCKITGGNPLATLTLSGVCSGAKATDKSTLNASILEISLTINRTYNNKSCVCTATHPLQWFRRSQSVTFTVQYGPGPVRLSPDTTSYTLIEDKETFGPITCRADCKPDCQYNWIRNGTVVASGSVIQINNISISQKGKYQCLATNEYNKQGKTSNSIVVLVEDETDDTLSITRNSSGQLSEGMTIKLGCELSSVKPLASLSWTCKGSPVKSTNTSIADIARQELVIAIDRSYDGNMCVCTGNHPLWPERRNKSVAFYVLYPPRGNIGSIQRSPQKLNYQQNEPVTLICRSPSKSKPMAEITWQCNGADVTYDAKNTNEDNRAVSELTIITDLSYNNYKCSCNVYYSMTGYNQSAESDFVILGEEPVLLMTNKAIILLASSGTFLAILTTVTVTVFIKWRKNRKKSRPDSKRIPQHKALDLWSQSHQDLQNRDRATENQYRDFSSSAILHGTYRRSSYLEPVISQKAADIHYQHVQSTDTAANLPDNSHRSSYLHPIMSQRRKQNHYQEVEITDAVNPNRTSYLEPVVRLKPEENHHQEIRNSDVIVMNVVQPSAEVRTDYEKLTQPDVPATYDTLTNKPKKNHRRSSPEKNRCNQQ